MAMGEAQEKRGKVCVVGMIFVTLRHGDVYQ